MIGGQASRLGARVAIGGKLLAMIGALISVDEHLHTVYRPDCDYMDREVLERNMIPRAELFAAVDR